jgi:hypothetical protein
MISNQFQHALPHAVMSKSLQMTWKTANLVSFYAWRNTKTLFKGFKYFRGDLQHQLQNYLIKILTNCQLIMSIWVPVEKNQCKLPLKQAVEYSRDMNFPTVLSCIITAVDSAHKDQYNYNTAERIPQQHLDTTTTSLRVVISIWVSVTNCQVITFIMNSHDSRLTSSVPNSEWQWVEVYKNLPKPLYKHLCWVSVAVLKATGWLSHDAG